MYVIASTVQQDCDLEATDVCRMSVEKRANRVPSPMVLKEQQLLHNARLACHLSAYLASQTVNLQCR